MALAPEPPEESPPSSSVSSGEPCTDAAVGNSHNGLSETQVEQRRVLAVESYDERCSFTKQLNLRRQVYKDLTAFQMYPLQAMAVESHDEQLQSYVNAGGNDGGCGSDDGSEDSDTAPRREQSTLSAEEGKMRGQFRREFLRERSIPVPPAGDVNRVPAVVGETVKNEGQEKDGSASDADDQGGSTVKRGDSPEVCDDAAANSAAQQLPAKASGHEFLPILWSMEPRIFASETAIKGKRRYISAHLGRFMDHYWMECTVHNRHYYELIKEGSPCRLYFDLEFNRHANPDLSPTVTEDLLDELFAELNRQFQLTYDLSIDRSGMVDLDSSTPKKFSRHWILHLPNGELFSDAREAGIFVKGFVARLEEEKDSGALQSRGRKLLANNLFVNAEDSKEDDPKLTRFIDLGVYTRNRIFRLLGSTKFGKPPSAALRIAEANQFPFGGFDNTNFFLSAMSNAASEELDVETAAGTVDRDDDFESFCQSLSFEDHAAALAATLVVPANASKMNYPILSDPSDLLSEEQRQQIMGLRVGSGTGGGGISSFPRAAPSYGKSPFPELEGFIVNTLGKRGGGVGVISTWSLGTQQPLPQTICFNMKENRYCEKIGRAHKSNNVMWNVHLIDRVCWQACHDPECRGFRGESIDLPEECNLEIDEFFLDFELSSLNEKAILDDKENGEGEFDDPALEAALQELDLSRVAKEKEAEAALDDELANIDLDDIVRSCREKKPPLSDANNRADDASSRSDPPANKKSESDAVQNTAVSSDPLKNGNGLDSELLELASALSLNAKTG
ncbi:hypothetical protein ACHAXT_008562 [Thalassiosira profunda]